MDLLILVTGAPGTGKTTLARALAPALGLPLLAKDTIKEALGRHLGVQTVEESQRLGRATYEVIFTVAAWMPRAIIDANLERERAGPKVAALHPDPIELFCRCEPEIAMARYEGRRRDPVHVDHLMGDELRARLERGQHALDLGGPVLEVDTGEHVDTAATAEWVRALPQWSSARL